MSEIAGKGEAVILRGERQGEISFRVHYDQVLSVGSINKPALLLQRPHDAKKRRIYNFGTEEMNHI